jgi:DHA2 family multidrug resistance protein
VLRNLGGSMGIAAVTTMVERFQQIRITDLVSHITPYKPGAAYALESMRQLMQSQGVPMSTAAQQSYAAMFGLVQRQAAILSYLDVFRDLAVVFVVMTPLVLLMRKPQQSGPPPAAH